MYFHPQCFDLQFIKDQTTERKYLQKALQRQQKKKIIWKANTTENSRRKSQTMYIQTQYKELE